MSAPIAHRISVPHDRGSYSVLIGSGALAAEEFADALRGRRVFVMTSAPVRSLHGERLESALAGAKSTCWLEVADGEAAKTVDTAAGLWNRMLDLGGKRDSLVVAFGGGSIGDLAGFVAATFLRGIDFIQVPTTLLAQVDASVGGKVAVDLDLGKNTVGAFHQPILVVADTAVLTTLDGRDLTSGLVESLKMGLILDRSLVERIERLLADLERRDPGVLVDVVAHSVRVKAAVVKRDPFEAGDRKLLNFGHTLGHAIEVCLGYSALRHGEAVGHGMLFATQLSRYVGLSEADAARITSSVSGLNLPPLPPLQVKQLVAACYRDKKAKEGALTWVLCPSIGDGVLVDTVERVTVERELARFLGQAK